jgi:Asp-tRNA(Asn)/Glu-tRNA(Gln) amidotransferase A subunit family amidase
MRTSPSHPSRGSQQWIKSRQITSERLTNIYLKRLETFDPKLHCVITLDARARA